MSAHLPPLLPPEAFREIFDPLAGQRVGIVDCPGNAGDRMIHLATRQLADHFKVQWRTFVPWADPVDGLEALLLFGGGSMGSSYPAGRVLLRAALATGLPCDVLPQTWIGPAPGAFRRQFARERVSLQWQPQAQLAPDLALGVHVDLPDAPPTKKLAVFLRRDRERDRARRRVRSSDPASRAWLPTDYVRLAQQFEEIITDRLHFAIAGLIARRQVILLPGNTHKNRAVWEFSLSTLGCGWAERIPPR